MNTKKKIVRKKKMHFAIGYPCDNCGHLETICGYSAIFEFDNKNDWTEDAKKVSCRECKRELRIINE